MRSTDNLEPIGNLSLLRAGKLRLDRDTREHFI
jgi:hypothetical protein